MPNRSRRARPWVAALGALLGLSLAGPTAATQRIETLIVIVDFADQAAPASLRFQNAGAAQTLPLTTANAESVLFTMSGSTADRFHEMSYGAILLTGSALRVSIPLSLATSELGVWKAAADAEIMAVHGLDPGAYPRVGYLVPHGFQGQVGNGGALQNALWFWASPPTPGHPWINERTVSHEFGHTLDMRHAAEIQPSGSLSEIGDQSDFMGTGPTAHAGVVNKHRAGWMDGRILDVAADSLVTIPLEALASPSPGLAQAIRIPTHGALAELGAPVDTWLSYRAPVGFDQNLGTTTDSFLTPILGSVLVRHERRDGKLFAGLERALVPGASIDVNGTHIEVLGTSGTTATVRIDHGTYAPVAPGVVVTPLVSATAYPGETIEFEVEVSNPGGAGISFPAWYESTFTTPGAFWTATWDVLPKEILVDPGTTTTVSTLRVRAPYATPPGVHDIGVEISTEGTSGTVSTQVSVPITIVPAPDSMPPPPPSALGGTSSPGAGDDFVVLSWTAPPDDSDVMLYQPYRNGVALPTPASKNTSYVDFVFDATVPNAYVVRSMDAAGNLSEPSEVFAIGAPDTQAPDVPTGLGGSVGGGGLEMTWPVPFDDVWVASYRIFRDGMEIGTSTEPRYVDTTPPLGTSNYSVIAVDGYGNESPLSGTWQSEIVAVPALGPAARIVLVLILGVLVGLQLVVGIDSAHRWRN